MSAATAAAPQKLKIVFKDDIRRFPSSGASKATLADISAFVRASWPVFEDAPFCIRWTDEEGDDVTLATDHELLEARQSAMSAKQASLKLYVDHTLSSSESSLDSEFEAVDVSLSDDSASPSDHDEGSTVGAAGAADGTSAEGNDDQVANPKPREAFIKAGGAKRRSSEKRRRSSNKKRSAKKTRSGKKKRGRGSNKSKRRARKWTRRSEVPSDKQALRALKRICKRAAKLSPPGSAAPAASAASETFSLLALDHASNLEMDAFMEIREVADLLPAVFTALYCALARGASLAEAVDVALQATPALAEQHYVRSHANQAMRVEPQLAGLVPAMLALGEEAFVALGPAILRVVPSVFHSDAPKTAVEMADFLNLLKMSMKRKRTAGGPGAKRNGHRRARRQGGGLKYRADIVAHVNLTDNTQVRPGQELVKTWSVTNPGVTDWPEGTFVTFYHRGCREIVMAPDQRVVQAAKPGDTVEVSVKIVVPTIPGRYKSFFRLAEPAGGESPVRPFGQMLWVQLVVVA